MNNALKSEYAPFLTEQSLRSAIENICSKFGRVIHLEILPAKLGPNLQCACFLRLDSAAAQTILRSRLQVVDFDGTLACFADVDDGWMGDRAKVDNSRSTDAPFLNHLGQLPSRFSHTSMIVLTAKSRIPCFRKHLRAET